MTKKYTSIVFAGLVTALTACGGGGSGGDSPITPSAQAESAPQATATLTVPAINKFPWAIETPITVTLNSPLGDVVPVITCQSADSNVVAVISDCSAVTLKRLGAQNITVNGGGYSANVSLVGVPQRHWSGVHGVASSQGSGNYSLLALADGTSLTWGGNPYGTLGQNQNVVALTHSGLPIPVLNAAGEPSLNQLYQVSAGNTSAFALSEDGSVWGWGRNFDCDLAQAVCGNAILLPVRVQNATNTGALGSVVQIEKGGANNAALLDNGTVMTWAYYHGQGDNNRKNFPGLVKTPDGTASLSDIVAISAGEAFSLALAKTGKVYAWGYDLSSGRLGSGTVSNSPSALPNTVKMQDGSELTNIVSISAGYNFSLALASDGSVWAWGDNSQGQLGQNTQTYSGVPYAVQVKGAGISGGLLENIVMVAAGGHHALALDSTGKVFAWGFATSGELGEGASRTAGNQSSLPIATLDFNGVSQLTDVVSIAAGFATSSALKSDGILMMWGGNFRGALGRGETNGTWANSAVATPVVADATLAPLTIGPLTSYPNLKRRSR